MRSPSTAYIWQMPSNDHRLDALELAFTTVVQIVPRALLEDAERLLAAGRDQATADDRMVYEAALVHIQTPLLWYLEGDDMDGTFTEFPEGS